MLLRIRLWLPKASDSFRLRLCNPDFLSVSSRTERKSLLTQVSQNWKLYRLAVSFCRICLPCSAFKRHLRWLRLHMSTFQQQVSTRTNSNRLMGSQSYTKQWTWTTFTDNSCTCPRFLQRIPNPTQKFVLSHSIVWTHDRSLLLLSEICRGGWGCFFPIIAT